MIQDYHDGAFYNADCFDVMPVLPTGCVDLCVTSPPYDNLREYNGMAAFTMDVFKPIAREITRLLKPGAVVVWNVADATVNGSETGTSFRQALYFKDECGLNLHDTMIWQKPNVFPKPSNRYEQSFEYMFVISKGKPKTFNGLRDKPNVGFGRKLSGNKTHDDGSKIALHGTGKTVAEFGLRHNVWEMNTANGKRPDGHPAPYPLALPTDHILSWSNPNDIVLDPFAGSGTTAVAARNTGRRWICIERDETYFNAANARLTA